MRFSTNLPGLSILTALLFVAVSVPRPLAAQESVESKYLSNIRQVTTGFEKAGEGYFSPDAKTIVYQAVQPQYPFYQIFTQPLDGGTPKMISTGRGRTTCSYFSPDGKHLLFASSHLNPDLAALETKERQARAQEKRSGKHRRYSWPFDPYMDIYVCDLDGQNRKRLTSEYGYDAEGAYSQDGKLIAYCHVQEPDDTTSNDANGQKTSGQKTSGQKTSGQKTSGQKTSGKKTSGKKTSGKKTSGQKTSGQKTGVRNPDIYVMNADGSGKRRITSAPGYDGGPFISPHGEWIVYRTDRKKAEHLQIHVIGIDGNNDVAVTDSPNSVNWGPYWHPTLPYVIWSGADHSDPNARPNYDLQLMRYEIKDGEFVPGPITRVTDSPAADVLPVFSPDGTKLMWTSTRTKNHTSQLFIADFTPPVE